MAGRKNTNVHKLEFGDGETIADMSDDFSSEASNILFQDNVGLQVRWSGDAVGTITVECSNNKDPNTHESGDFYSLTFDPELEQPAGASGGYLINLNQVPFEWVRISYVADSGSGDLECWLTSKEV